MGGGWGMNDQGVVGVDVRRAAILGLQRPRGFPAVSVLMPTHRHFPDSAQDPIRLRNLLGDARDRLSAGGSDAGAGDVLAQLERAVGEVDFPRTLDGLAIFAAEAERHVLHLPVPVRERVVIDTTFATRDLVRALQRTPRCWVLVLSERSAGLLESLGEHLVEIVEGGFPLVNEEEGEPLPAGFGQEPSAYHRAWRRRFFRRVDEALAPFVKDQPLPLIVMGTTRTLAFFDEVSRHRDLVIGRVVGGHEAAAPHRLAELVRPVIERYVSERRAAALGELEAAISERRYAAGFAEVSQLVRQGRGAHLLVEENFGMSGTAGAEHGTAPAGQEHRPSGDAVDELVEAALAASGRVSFVDDGALADRGHVALILRY